MKRFKIDTCPLCGAGILPIVGAQWWQCPTTVTLQSGTSPVTHYQVETVLNKVVQHILVPPFAVETYSDTWRTSIYRWEPCYSGNSYRLGNWVFIMEVERINPDEPEKLVKRIKTLVPFA